MRWFLPFLLMGCGLPSAPVAVSQVRTEPSSPPLPSPQAEVPPQIWSYEVLQRYPHDPKAYTQGLWMDEGGQLWETTGQEKQSTLRKVDLVSGRYQVLHRLKDDEFGEGLAFSGGMFFWLTWKNQRCYRIDRLGKLSSTLAYEGEGWGLCADPSGALWMSDGSQHLVLRDPVNFKPKRRLEVRCQGEPLRLLNELEWVDGRIFANIYGNTSVAVIDPQDGRVESLIDCGGLLSPQESAQADVLNGIAYRASSGQLWLTGKNWPKLFEIRIRR